MLEAARRKYPFFVNSAYATISAGSAVLLLVLLLIAGRLLSAADYGRFSYALALTTIIETIMDVGLGQVTVRAVARDRAAGGQLFRNVLGLKLVWVAIGMAILLIVTPILRPDARMIGLCYLMGVSSAVRSYLLTTRSFLQGLDRFDLEAVLVAADRVLLLVIGALALIAGYGVYGLAAAFVISRLSMLGVVIAIVRRVAGSVRPAFDRPTWRELQAAAVPLGFFIIAMNTYTYIDTVILGIMRSDAETGWYAASYRIYEGLTYAPSILASVLTPRLSHLFIEAPKEHRRVMIRVLIAAVALGVVLGGATMWGARPIVMLLFGAAYEPAAAPLRVLAGGALFVFGTWILNAAAISTNLDRRLLGTTIVGLTTNVALNLALIPRLGIVGAAWATVAAEALTLVLLFVQIERRLREA